LGQAGNQSDGVERNEGRARCSGTVRTVGKEEALSAVWGLAAIAVAAAAGSGFLRRRKGSFARSSWHGRRSTKCEKRLEPSRFRPPAVSVLSRSTSRFGFWFFHLKPPRPRYGRFSHTDADHSPAAFCLHPSLHQGLTSLSDQSACPPEELAPYACCDGIPC
jgi:hypothetical protein